MEVNLMYSLGAVVGYLLGTGTADEAPATLHRRIARGLLWGAVLWLMATLMDLMLGRPL